MTLRLDATADTLPGHLALTGNVTDLRQDDLVFGGELAVFDAAKASEDSFGWFDLELCNPSTKTCVAIVSLRPDLRLRLQRPTGPARPEIEWPVDPQSADAIVCPGTLPPTHRGLVATTELPRGRWVSVKQASGRAAAQVVDTAYANGMILFTDGTVIQSEPQNRWNSWVFEDERAPESTPAQAPVRPYHLDPTGDDLVF